MPTIAFYRSQFRASPNHRHLITSTGLPFFWLADRMHMLLRHLQRPDIDRYVQTRAAQRFSVMQMSALPGPDAMTVPNAYGLLPFNDGDVTQPVEGYFAHLDYFVLRANLLGMAVALEIADAGIVGSAITEENAVGFANYLSNRFQEQAVIWVLGSGDAPEDAQRQAIWSQIGQALKTNTKGRHLIAYLPSRSATAGASWCQGESWLDIALQRSGPAYNPLAWRAVEAGYIATPERPVLDGGPCAEDQPTIAGEEDGRLSAQQIRRLVYTSVFAGGCGYTYRNHSVECCHRVSDTVDHARTPWHDALFDPAAEELHFLRLLVESRPFQVRVPDQLLVANQASNPAHQPLGTRADDDDLGGDCGSYAFIYSPDGSPVTVDLTRLSGSMVVAAWFDPRSGRGRWLGQFPVRGSRVFTPPSADDWVLVLDDASRNYPPVGLGSDRGMSI